MFQSGLSSLMFAWPFVWPGGVLYTSFEIIYYVMSCHTTVLCFFFCCFLIVTEENLVHSWTKAHSHRFVGWLENRAVTRSARTEGRGHCSLSSREWYQKMTTAPFLALFSFSPFSSTQVRNYECFLFRYRKFFLLRLHTAGRLLTGSWCWFGVKEKHSWLADKPIK